MARTGAGANDVADTDASCRSQDAISTLMSRSPRLESRDGTGSSTFFPPTAYHPSLMLASTELSVYIKWALLLQEHLEQVQAERAGLAQQCGRLQTDNQMLREMLFAEDPIKYAKICESDVPLKDWTENNTSDQQDAARSESEELTPPVPAPRPTNWRETLANSTTSRPGSAALPQADLLSSPNLRMLASFLKEAPGAPGPSLTIPRSAEVGRSKLSSSFTDAPATKLMRTQPPSEHALSSLYAFDELAAAGLSARPSAAPSTPRHALTLDGEDSEVRS